MGVKITSAQAAKLLNTTAYSINRGLEYKTLDIGWYTKVKGASRGSAHIVPEKLAHELHITVDELEQRIANLN